MGSRIPAANAAQATNPQASLDERKGIITVKSAGGTYYLSFEGKRTDKATLEKMKLVWQDLSQQLSSNPEVTMRNIQRAAKDSKETVSHRASNQPRDPYVYKCEYDPATHKVEFFRKRQSALQNATPWESRPLEKRAARAGQSALPKQRKTVPLHVHSSTSSSSSGSGSSSSSSSFSSPVPTETSPRKPTEEEARIEAAIQQIEASFDTFIHEHTRELSDIETALNKAEKNEKTITNEQIEKLKQQIDSYQNNYKTHVLAANEYMQKNSQLQNDQGLYAGLRAKDRTAVERVEKITARLARLEQSMPKTES